VHARNLDCTLPHCRTVICSRDFLHVCVVIDNVEIDNKISETTTDNHRYDILNLLIKMLLSCKYCLKNVKCTVWFIGVETRYQKVTDQITGRKGSKKANYSHATISELDELGRRLAIFAKDPTKEIVVMLTFGDLWRYALSAQMCIHCGHPCSCMQTGINHSTCTVGCAVVWSVFTNTGS